MPDGEGQNRAHAAEDEGPGCAQVADTAQLADRQGQQQEDYRGQARVQGVLELLGGQDQDGPGQVEGGRGEADRLILQVAQGRLHLGGR